MDGRTDGQTDGAQLLMRLLSEGRMTKS